MYGILVAELNHHRHTAVPHGYSVASVRKRVFWCWNTFTLHKHEDHRCFDSLPNLVKTLPQEFSIPMEWNNRIQFPPFPIISLAKTPHWEINSVLFFVARLLPEKLLVASGVCVKINFHSVCESKMDWNVLHTIVLFHTGSEIRMQN